MGYKNLDMDRRKEYSELKVKLGTEPVAPAPTPTPAKTKEPVSPAQTQDGDDNISIKRSELQDMINTGIENYRKAQPRQPEMQGDWKEVDASKGTNQTAKLRLYQVDTQSPYGAVIRCDYLKMGFDEESRNWDNVIYEIEVMYEDKEVKKYEIDHKAYAKLNLTEDVELIENDRKMLRQVSGKIGMPMKDNDGYPIIKMNGGGYGSAKGVMGEVDLEVIRFDETFTVRRPNGQEFKIHGKYLNQ